MADSRHAPNPLRPYYIPPSIGREAPTVSAPPSRSESGNFSFPDLDYADYIPDASPSIAGTVKRVLDKAVSQYATIVVAQPLEVAKIILQTKIAVDEEADLSEASTPNSRYRELYEEQGSDEEEPNYFTSAASFGQTSPSVDTPTRGRRGRPYPHKRASLTSQPKSTSESLHLKNPNSLLEALSALSSSDGPLAVWRATNSTFIYSVLNRTLETFLRSLLSAILGISESDLFLPSASAIPDSQILNSNSPAAAVLIATLSASIAALILSPIDTARTRLILTPSTAGPRSLLGALKTLTPSWLIPSHLIPITLLTSSLPTLISTTTPVFLKSYMRLDPAMNPAAWSVLTFVASAIDLSVKFPFETVLRRAQIATWTSPELALKYTTSGSRQNPQRSRRNSPIAKTSLHPSEIIQTIVPVPDSYPGIMGTIMQITRNEGYSESAKDKEAVLRGQIPKKRRKGQGIEGLYRGWRVGLWGLVGIWGSGLINGMAEEGPGIPNSGKF